SQGQIQTNAALAPSWLGVASFVVAVGLIVFAGAVPSEYEAAERYDYILPVIHHVLALTAKERLVIHRFRRFPTRGYEQLVDYYPPQAKRTRGRTFPLNHGIVAQCFSTHRARAWAIKPGVPFQDA